MSFVVLLHTDSLQTSLQFESSVSEVFATDDGSVLDIDCVVAYSYESEKKANDMLSLITSAIAGSQCAGIVKTVTQMDSFFGFGNQVSQQHMKTHC